LDYQMPNFGLSFCQLTVANLDVDIICTMIPNTYIMI
jgi:hypothetical protein